MKNVLCLFLGLIVSGQLLAQPVSIEFEGVAAAGTEEIFLNPYTEGGFDLYKLDAGFNTITDFRVTSATTPGVGVVGSDFGYVQNPAYFRVLAATPFDLSAIQLGGAYGSSGSVTITGTLVAGGTVSETATIIANTYTDVNFPVSWTGLSQVDFVYSDNFLAIDNVVLAPTAIAPPVSVPSLSVWMILVLSVLIGLFSFRKFKVKF